jgi:hypothetical protein
MLKTDAYLAILLVLMLVIVIVEDQSNDEIRMTNDKGMAKPK